ncbi:tetraspanin-31 [Trichonephila clavipes]|uniref:Tetraspanin-31 n=1 Tax=Trichonephila inaurata madagascariensis TaxID=2747483 RepID=A0A8X6XQI3_9ARAC|nr:tetraspanin-31 [Trichonephila clavipes]GFY56744.1 tetraspanin-31 [Trichonephila inaurata madagascariensis]GFY60045.1 tetraspanin-31 [Trichonephila inaurata madagascariensis]
MCGGFTCSRNALIVLNLLYVVVSFILISVAAYGIVASFVSSLAIVGGIIACGVFLFLLSLMGLIGAARHSQVLLFFYMIILFMLFVVQFSIACACLAFNEDQQYKLAYEGWHQASMGLRNETQMYFDCCGFQNASLPEGHPMKAPSCSSVRFCQESLENMKICEDSGDTCWMKLQKVMNNALKISGGVGLFFSFSEFIGVWLTVRYRNQKDPRSNPHAFL